MSMRSILLCEDDPIQLGILTTAFRKAGYAPLTARSPVEALEQTRKETVDAIVTDVCLENGNAFDLTDGLSRSGVDTPVIMASGYATENMHLRARTAGAAKLFEKPYDIPKILEFTEQVIRRKPARRIGARVLVVEDHEPVRLMTAQGLDQAGFDVLAVENGEKALDLLRKEGRSIFMVLCDMHLPGLYGAGLIGEMRHIIPGLFVAMVTGEGRHHEIQAGYQAGAAALIRKPFSPRRVAEFLEAELPHARSMRWQADERRRKEADPWYKRALRRLHSFFLHSNGTLRMERLAAVGLCAGMVISVLSYSEAYTAAARLLYEQQEKMDRMVKLAEERAGGDPSNDPAVQRWYLQEKVRLERDANTFTRKYYEDQVNLMRFQQSSFPGTTAAPVKEEEFRNTDPLDRLFSR